MDPRRFDRLSKTLATAGTRRALVRLLLGVPLVGSLTGLLDVGETAARRPVDRVLDRGERNQEKRRNRSNNNGGKGNRGGKGGNHKGKGKHKPSPGPGPGPTCIAPKPRAPGATQGLQEAINKAGDTLTLCAGTWHLKKTVTIDKNLTLIGAGAGKTILDGRNTVRVLQIAFETTVTLQDLTITRGKVTGSSVLDDAGGGIKNIGTLTLVGVSVTKNTADFGGGISNVGTLTLEAGSSVTKNTADGDGGGIYNDNGGTVDLQAKNLVCNNTLDNNCAGDPSGTTYPDDCCPG